MLFRSNIIYNLNKWANISYYLTTFIYNNLPKSIDDNTFASISASFNIFESQDVREMAAVYEIANFKDSIANSDLILIDEEEKSNLNKQIEVLEQYEQLAFYLIKSCNDFIIKLSGGAFKDGFLFSYDTIVNELSEDAKLLEKFNSVKVNLDAPREKVENAEIRNVIWSFLF
mgnify:FL=1